MAASKSNLPRPEGAELLQAILSRAEEVTPVTLDLGGGLELELELKPLGWMARSRAVSEASEVRAGEAGGDPVTVFRLDRYYAHCLRAMVVSSPFPLTTQVIERLGPAVGLQLERLIPPPFEAMALEATEKKG